MAAEIASMADISIAKPVKQVCASLKKMFDFMWHDSWTDKETLTLEDQVAKLNS
jgi:hypothetical protein